MNRLVFYILLLTFSIRLSAQHEATSHYQSLNFDPIDARDDLSQGTVMCIHEDHEGFLWFGTQHGLNRWDGYHMSVWKHNNDDMSSISSGYIRALYADQHKNIWIGIEGSGLNIMDLTTGHIRKYAFDRTNKYSINSNFIFSIYEDHEHRVWVGTSEGLCYFDPEHDRFIRVNFLASIKPNSENNFVQALREDRAGRLWIATKQGLYCYSPKTNSVESFLYNPLDQNSICGNNIKTILVDRLQQVWVGSYGQGISCWNPTTKKFTTYAKASQANSETLSDNYVYALCNDLSDQIWIATYNGLNLFNPQTKKFICYKHIPGASSSLKNNLIIAIYIDHLGSLWVSTSGNGVSHATINEKRFKAITDEADKIVQLPNRFVYSIAETSDEKLWIGTAGGGLCKWDIANNVLSQVALPAVNNQTYLKRDIVRAILPDRQGHVWVGTDKGGLIRIDTKTNEQRCYTTTSAEHGILNSNIVISLYIDFAGVLWVGTFDGGLSRYDEKKDAFVNYTPQQQSNRKSISSLTIRCMYATSDGSFWVGTPNGLNRMNRDTETFDVYRHNEIDKSSISNDHIRCIYEDHSGIIWIGTNGGGLNYLYKNKDGKFCFRALTEKDGLPDNVIYSILEDDSGNLWMGTNSGICFFRLANFRKKVQQSPSDAQLTADDYFRIYTLRDGLAGNEFNGGAMLKAKKGTLFFGGVDGLTYFQSDWAPDDYPLHVVITDILVFNQSLQIDPKQNALDGRILRENNAFFTDKSAEYLDRIVLNYTENNCSFEFSALHFGSPEEVEYAYFLDGFDQNWNEIGSRRFITFSNLPHGEYTLHLKARFKNRTWTEMDKTIRLKIIPPFWKTSWFYSICFVFVVLAVLVYVRIKTATLLKTNVLLEQRVNERTTEVLHQKDLIETKNHELERLNLINQKIFAIISHDFKEPLLSMRLLVEALKKEQQGNYRMLAYTADMKDQLANADLNLQNLLNWAKLQLAISEKPTRKTCSIHDAIETIRCQLVTSIRRKQITIVNQINPNLIANLPEETVLIVFRNLISNAIKFSYDEGVIVCGFDDDSQSVFVKDEGIGMSPAQTQALFSGIVESGPGTNAEKGYGLGLYLTNEILGKGNGAIRVISEEKNGSIFYIKIPIVQL